VKILSCLASGTIVLALAACAAVDNLQTWRIRMGPVPIGPEWTEIHCPEPVEATARYQALLLMIPVGSDVPNFHHKEIVFADGKRVALFAEIVDVEGRVYPLPKWQQRTIIRGRNQPAEDGRLYPYIPLTTETLPLTVRFKTVRLRSSAPIVLQDVIWMSHWL